MTTGCQKFVEGFKTSVSGTVVNFLLRLPDANSNLATAGTSIAMILISPIGLVEAVVRGIFALLAAPIAFFLPEGEARDWYNQHIFSPLSIGCLASVIAAGLGLGLGVANFTRYFNESH